MEEQLAISNGNIIEKYVTNPLKDWFNLKLISFGDWLKYNILDLLTVIAIVIIATMGFKIFLQIILNRKQQEDSNLSVIFLTITIYTIVRLFWKVVFYV